MVRKGAGGAIKVEIDHLKLALVEENKLPLCED